MSIVDSFKDIVMMVIGIIVTIFSIAFAFKLTSKKKPDEKTGDVESAVNSVNNDMVKQIQSKQTAEEKIVNITKDTNGKIDVIKETPVGDSVGLDDNNWNKSAGGGNK